MVGCPSLGLQIPTVLGRKKRNQNKARSREAVRLKEKIGSHKKARLNEKTGQKKKVRNTTIGKNFGEITRELSEEIDKRGSILGT